MNKVTLIGRLTKAPVAKQTNTGKNVASFSLAVNEGKDEVQYFNCTAWDKKADVIAKYTNKGYQVAVSGKLQNRSWDKPDGSKAYATEIVVYEIELLGSKRETAKETWEQTADSMAGEYAKQELPDIAKIDISEIETQMPF